MLKNPNDTFVFQLNMLNFNSLPLLVAGKNEINFKIIQLKKKIIFFVPCKTTMLSPVVKSKRRGKIF